MRMHTSDTIKWWRQDYKQADEEKNRMTHSEKIEERSNPLLHESKKKKKWWIPSHTFDRMLMILQSCEANKFKYYRCMRACNTNVTTSVYLMCMVTKGTEGRILQDKVQYSYIEKKTKKKSFLWTCAHLCEIWKKKKNVEMKMKWNE